MKPDEAEVARVLALPVIPPPTPEDVEEVSRTWILPEAYDRGERLKLGQVEGLVSYLATGGLLGRVPLGGGKTGLSLLLAQVALAHQGMRRAMLLVSVGQVDGLLRRHVPEWRKRIAMDFDIHYLSGHGPRRRRAIAESGKSGLYVMTYSLLSAADRVELVTAIQPELVIADEAHRLKNVRSSACAKAFVEMMETCRARFAPMSGTLLQKGLGDYGHVARYALGDGCPMPRTRSGVYLWDQVLQARAEEKETNSLVEYARGLLDPLRVWAQARRPGEDFPRTTEGYRRAYQVRLRCAPGVVSIGEDDLGVDLSIANQPADTDRPGWDKLQTLVRKVDGWQTPSGEPIDHAIHTWKWYFQLSSGFYYDLVWPTPEHLAALAGIDLAEAEDRIQRARVHHDAECDYRRLLRTDWFDVAPAGLDTPREVGTAARRRDPRLPEAVADAWHRVHALDFPGRPKRLQVPVRVCDYKIQHALLWAAGGPGILWYSHREVGAWLAEVLAGAGLDPLLCPQGADAEIEAVGDPVRGGRGDRLVVASIKAHHMGRNLQAFRRQLVLEWPRQATVAQQLIGRTHRHGQQADALVVDTCVTTEWEAMCRAACLMDAQCVSQLDGPQKILEADYDPLPVVYAASVLRRRGARLLGDEEDETALRRRFGAAETT